MERTVARVSPVGQALFAFRASVSPRRTQGRQEEAEAEARLGVGAAEELVEGEAR